MRARAAVHGGHLTAPLPVHAAGGAFRRRHRAAGEFPSPGMTQQCGSMGARPIPLTPGHTNLLNRCSRSKPPIPSLGPPIRTTHGRAGQEAGLPDQTQRRPKLMHFTAGRMSSSGTGNRALIRGSHPHPLRSWVTSPRRPGRRQPFGRYRRPPRPRVPRSPTGEEALSDLRHSSSDRLQAGSAVETRSTEPLEARSTGDRKESGLAEYSTEHRVGITCAAAARWPAKPRRPSPRPYPLRPPWPRARSGPGASRAVASPRPANPW